MIEVLALLLLALPGLGLVVLAAIAIGLMMAASQ